eukprot:374880_1
MSKIIFDIKGIDLDGNDSTQTFKLPSTNDWGSNLEYINKKINKKFSVDNEYGLAINDANKIRFDDVDGFTQAMSNFNSNNDELSIEIIDINDIETAGDYRMIIVHYGNDEFRFKVGQDLSTLDEE